MAFKVAQIVNECTIMVHPHWKMRNLRKKGKFVKINGYRIPQNKQSLKQEAKMTLFNNLFGKVVKLENPIRLTPSGHVVCDVFVDGKNVKDLFPEYQTK